MTIGIADALMTLRPGAEWSCGNTYASITWFDQIQTKPTEQEVNDELARLEQEYIDNEYQRLREKEYPTWEDQMDLLYHSGYDGWKAAIQAVKDKYPKPV